MKSVKVQSWVSLSKLNLRTKNLGHATSPNLRVIPEINQVATLNFGSVVCLIARPQNNEALRSLRVNEGPLA